MLKDMIFPQCEKLGQTIIFVRTRETARLLHNKVGGTLISCLSRSLMSWPCAAFHFPASPV